MNEDDEVVKFDDLRAHEQAAIFEELLGRLGLVIVRNPYNGSEGGPSVRLESTPSGEATRRP
jgi:hypothetical protein